MFLIPGTIYKKFDTTELEDGRRYRTFWLKTHEQRPQYIRMQLREDGCDVIDEVDPNMMVLVHFYISGQPKERNGENNLYNNNNAFKIEFTGS